MEFKKIQIVGLSGVGKTEFCKKNFKKNIFHIDNIIYEKKFSKKNIKKNINEKLNEIFKKNFYIIDGTFINFKFEDYKKNDLVIIIEKNFFKIFFNITKRYLKNKNNEYSKFSNFLKNLKILFLSYTKNKNIIYEHTSFIKKNCNYVIIENEKSLKNFKKLYQT